MPLFGEALILSLIFFFRFVPSLMSPPEPGSPSLPLPPTGRDRLLSVLDVDSSVSLTGSTLSFTIDVFRWFKGCGLVEVSTGELLDIVGAGDLGREAGGTGVDVPEG